MKTFSCCYTTFKIFALVAVIVLCGTHAASAGGFIYTPTQAALEAALAGGGTATFECNGTIVLTNTILISADTVLDGNGFTVTISGGNALRIFQVAPGVSYWIKSLTLSDGKVMAPNGADGSPPSPGQDALGGAILCQGGNLTLTGCILSNNFVQGGHGGTETNPTVITGISASGGMGAGGAIYASHGTLNLTNCALLSSVAVGGLGSMLAYYPLGAGTGAGGSACGGAIYMSNVTASLAQVTFASNRLTSGATQGGGQNNSGGPGGDSLGGAICVTNSSLLIANSSFVTNSAIAADAILGTGFGRCGGGIGGALWVSYGSTAMIQISSFSGNMSKGGEPYVNIIEGPAMGGAIASFGSLLLTDSSISGNHTLPGSGSYSLPGRGGGVYGEGPLTLNRCTFENNQAVGAFGAGIQFYPGLGGAGEGGAIWSSGTLMATNCTCATNRATGGQGGGINGVGGPGRGGAIFASAGGTLINLTLAYNRADSQAYQGNPAGPAQGGGLAVTNSPLTVRGTIIANSSNGGEVWGVVTDAGYNICSDGTAGFTATGSLTNIDPLLGPLAYNGGPTKTIALRLGSPALDRIPSGFPPTDQRGVSRPQGPAAEVGAYESLSLPLPPVLTISSSGNNVTISFNAQGGLNYELLSSTNLRTWVSVATNSLPSTGILSFVQAFSPGPSAFYRVVTP